MSTQNPSRVARLASGAVGVLLGKLIAFVLLFLLVKGVAAFAGGVSWSTAAVLAGVLVILGSFSSRG